MSRITCRGVLQYLRATTILGLHALFVFLALARATGDDEWSWYIAFIPLFIFDLLSIGYWVFYLVSYIARKLDSDTLWTERNSVLFPGQSLTLLVLVAYGVGIPLKIAAEVLLLLHLQEPDSIRVFVPAILFMLLFLEVGIVAVSEMLSPMLRLVHHS